jgi:hypothetical protein
VLLCNYFDWFDRAGVSDGNRMMVDSNCRDHHHHRRRRRCTSYLVIGSALPEGRGVYVLRKDSDDGSIVLWNACVGTATNLHDGKCPLQQVLLVATSENIWANIQSPHVTTAQLDWDIGNKSRLSRYG